MKHQSARAIFNLTSNWRYSIHINDEIATLAVQNDTRKANMQTARNCKGFDNPLLTFKLHVIKKVKAEDFKQPGVFECILG